MKTPPKQFPDTVARDMVERFALPGAPAKAPAPAATAAARAKTGRRRKSRK